MTTLKQILVLTPNSLQVHDINTKKLVERSRFSAQSLMFPTLYQTVSGGVSHADSVLDVTHSVWVYKTRIFILVGSLHVLEFKLRAYHCLREEMCYKSALC